MMYIEKYEIHAVVCWGKMHEFVKEKEKDSRVLLEKAK